MKKSKLKKMDLDLYEEILDNKMRIFIVPKNNVNGIYTTFNTKFGSIYSEFYINNKLEKVPNGVAHFLEHKMFEQKDGKDPFTFYCERGCDSNANTSNYKTTYLFSGTNAFSDNLNYLLDYVQEPYFTDENVNKEKGIIEQEIKMYDDEPFFKLYNSIIKNSFCIHPIKYPIAGTVEDVYSITKEHLYTCYNTFYNPSNMFLVVTGNVNSKEVINIVKENQKNKKFDNFNKIKIKKYNEPDKVYKKFESINMDVVIPKVAVAYKINISKIDENINDIKTCLNLIFDYKFGSTSLMQETLKNNNLITGEIDITYINTDNHILAILMFESNESDKVLDLINDEMNNFTIPLEELERKKKLIKSKCIYVSDNIYAINNKIVNNIINYDEVILDQCKKIDQITMKNINKLINNINLDNKTIFKINKS